MAGISSLLFRLNVIQYAILVALTTVRVIKYTDKIIADFRNHGRCVGFFTSVAATSVLGSQFLLIGKNREIATILWILAIILLAGLTYGIFAFLTVKADKPTIAEGLNGGWLLAVVAPQSVSVLGSQLALETESYVPQVLMFCLVLWLGAGMLYIWIISLVFYRYTFFGLSPSDLAPPYWINMGAVAISALAGTMLISASHRSPLLLELIPFIKGFTLLFWSTATLWIPMLLILGIWRHIIRRFPLSYDPLYWGAVFPLGMYTASTYRLSRAVDAPFLQVIPEAFIYVALGAWILTFSALLYNLTRRRIRVVN